MVGETEVLPDVDCAPLQAPVAEHEVALVVLQFRVAELPRVMVVGVAVMVTAGATEVTFTVTDLEVVPPLPVQARLYVTAPEVVGVTLCDPLTDLVPVHAPPAVQDVASVLVHDSVLELPRLMLVGFAVKVTVGAGSLTVNVVDPVVVPPLPVQLRP